MSTATFALATLCAALMGFAIQRGATCMVAAVDEIVSKRRATRLLALGEAAAWVAGGLILAHLAGLLAMRPAAYVPTGATIAGAVLLGLGAFVNRACVFGAIARLGSGDWTYAATPIGFFLGCLTATPLFMAPLFMAPLFMTMRPRPGPVSTLFDHAPLLAVPVLALLLWRSAGALRAGIDARLAEHVWHPHHATAVIGLAFVVMMLTVGNWAYTDALADLARGMTAGLEGRMLLLFALILGALAGGRTAGRLRRVAPTAAGLARCLAGGLTMGWGSLLIPGGNDGLILVGLPLLQPHAWIAIATMALTIAIAMLAARRIAAIRAA